MKDAWHTCSGQESPNLAAAAYLIKDGGFSGGIYEEETLPGGALDAAGAPEQGYSTRVNTL
jgi:oleate hydratase